MTAEVKLTIDLTNVEQRKLLNALFDLMGNNEITPDTAPAKAPAKAPEKAKKNVREPEKEKKATTGADKPATKEAAITINDIRSLVSQKAATHRQELKAKLTELGAKNVTTLDKAKYTEFAEYLKAL